MHVARLGLVLVTCSVSLVACGRVRYPSAVASHLDSGVDAGVDARVVAEPDAATDAFVPEGVDAAPHDAGLDAARLDDASALDAGSDAFEPADAGTTCPVSTRWWIGDLDERALDLAVDEAGQRFVSIEGSLSTRPPGATSDSFLARLDDGEGYAWVEDRFATSLSYSTGGLFACRSAGGTATLDQIDTAAGSDVLRLNTLTATSIPDCVVAANPLLVAMFATVRGTPRYSGGTILVASTSGDDVAFIETWRDRCCAAGILGSSTADDAIGDAVALGTSVIAAGRASTTPFCLGDYYDRTSRGCEPESGWVTTFDADPFATAVAATPSEWRSIAVDATGNRYGAGSRLESITATGTLRWSVPGGSGARVAVSAAGRVFAATFASAGEAVAGHVASETGVLLLELDPATGDAIRWEERGGSSAVVLRRVLAQAGRVFVAGSVDRPFADCGATPGDRSGTDAFVLTWTP